MRRIDAHPPSARQASGAHIHRRDRREARHPRGGIGERRDTHGAGSARGERRDRREARHGAPGRQAGHGQQHSTHTAQAQAAQHTDTAHTDREHTQKRQRD